MVFDFCKYHGTGNDFIMADNRNRKFRLSGDQIRRLCLRHFGIGADGLIYLNKSVTADFSMEYFNADGKPGTMCGNGGRCIAAFAKMLGIVDREARFEASDGIHHALILRTENGQSTVKLKMKDVYGIRELEDGFFVDTGSPHFIRFVDDVDQIDLLTVGKEIRWSKRFAPGGTNVNFVQVHGNLLKIRSYERGVENITLSCGTGVVGAALAASYQGLIKGNSISVLTRGGELVVDFRPDKKQVYREVFLEGPAQYVFQGRIKL